MADDRIVISSEPGATPDEVARRSFPVVFRGYDQDQVRRFLKKVSDEMVAAREREQQLRQALEEARSTLAHPELDEATLTAALGEETTRILLSAREAANDMRTKAEERVARMVQEADEHGARLRLEAENVLARRVEEADEVAANIRAAAEADATHVHDRVQAELDAAKARGREMIAEAQAVRERIIGDLARRRRAAQIQIEQLLAGRDRLIETYGSVRGMLDDITAQLEHAEDEARGAAEAAHRRVVATPSDDSDLAEYAAGGVDEPRPVEELQSIEPEPAQPEPTAPEPDAWALPEPPVTPPARAAAAAAAEPEPADAPRPSLVRVEPFDEEEGVRIIGPVSQVSARVAESESEPEPEPASAPVAEQAAPSPGPVVEDLFARLRAERQGAVIKAQKVLEKEQPAPIEAAVVDVEEHAGPVDDEPAEDATAADGDRQLLHERDECLEPVASDLARRLKRVLQDEQNEILDRLRQNKGRTRVEDALPGARDQAARYRDAASAPLSQAADAGASFNGNAAPGDVPSGAWAQALGDELVNGLRERISRSLATVGEAADGNDAADSV